MMIASSIMCLEACGDAPDQEMVSISQEPSLAQQAGDLLPTLLDYLVTSRLADATAAMALEALDYRVRNRTLPSEDAARTYRLLGRAYAYQESWSAAAAAFSKAAEYGQERESKALARALSALDAGRDPDLVSLTSAGAARTFHCLTENALFHDQADLATDATGQSLEAMYFAVMTESTFTPPDDPAVLLPSFVREEGVEFSYYDPFTFRFLSRIYLRQLRNGATEGNSYVLALLESGADAAGRETFEPGSLEDDVVYLILLTAAGRGIPPGVRARLEQTYDESRPPLDRDMVHGYLALADGEVEEAFLRFEKIAQIDLPGKPREDFTSILLLDFMPLSYRVRSTNYVSRWILGANTMQEAFPYLKVPYFYLTWMQRESLLN